MTEIPGNEEPLRKMHPRREASNHLPLHWLKTVVANGAGKVGT